MRPVSRALCAFLLVACAAGGGACRKKEQPPEVTPPDEAWLEGRLPESVHDGSPKTGGTLVVRLPAEPSMLNRLHDAGQDAWGTRVMLGQVVETLLRVDPAAGYRLEGLLAERWELSEDRLRTTFHLRQGVRFHDGTAFTSADAVAVLDAVVEPDNPTSSMRGMLGDLERYEAPDAHTLVVHWKKASPTGLRNLGLNLPMFPAAKLGGDFDALALNRAPVGTGPFRFASWESGRQLTFVRNDAYWGRAAHLDRVEYRVVKDDVVATQLFERGEFDLMTVILPSVWRALEKPEPKNVWAQRDYHRIRYVENAYNWIGWNQRRPIFADARVRRAMTQLLPMESVARNIFLGLEPLTTCPFFSGGAYCDPALEAADSVQRLRHDPARAKALLAEAGFVRDTDGDGVLDRDGQPLRFTFLVWAHSVMLGKLAPLMQEELRKAGVQMDIERAEWAVFTQRLRTREFDVVSLGWNTADADTDPWGTFHSSQAVGGGRNYVGYVNAELDELLEERRHTFDEARKVELSRRIHRIVYADQVYTFLGARSALDAAKKRVRGLRPSLTWYRLADVWLEPAA